MAMRTEPAKTMFTCDACGRDIAKDYGRVSLDVGRSALDFQGAPVADASIHRDLCSRCAEFVIRAMNASISSIPVSDADKASCT